jgi:hypothetical protein
MGQLDTVVFICTYMSTHVLVLALILRNMVVLLMYVEILQKQNGLLFIRAEQNCPEKSHLVHFAALKIHSDVVLLDKHTI